MARSKSEYWLTPEGLTLIEGWARDGLTDDQIAHNMGVVRSTLSEWKIKFKDISDALKKGKEVVDREVENALLKKAMGYTVDLMKTFKVKRTIYENGKKVEEYEELVPGVDQVHVPADTTAQIFWLKNRKPEDWRDKREAKVEAELSDSGCVILPRVLIKEEDDG